ncbi:hypothetical protein GGTG_14035 [Gaeumannomyces tritici R3-111a-1]|uniref:TauD/TfdA-like domain-containing protein n=2 Tax=Gaeumannomyces tritici (strain R3-111a-1) TaxID=644352 RepID=J3PKH9_GAET3|nr:hypothetical protein GGTG_14035 [Gaeumannomyces tritici R3-111a-1]EJT68387.1 hypothetical protein GGTG_14035 [Gaeumannomyces tritici R3-111a-1]
MEPNQSLADSLSGWPRFLEGGLVWSGTGASPAGPHIVQLQPVDIAEIESALKAFKELGYHGDKVSSDTFRLSQNLQSRLRDASHDVHSKQGHCLLRGLEPNKYSPEDNAMIFLGIASHIGDVRGVQDSDGNMLSHITVVQQWKNVPDRLRHGVHTEQGMPFHNDMGTSVLALHYRQCASEGGSTHLSSAWTVYNELSANYPDVLEALATPNWPIQITKAKSRYYLAPLIQYKHGNLMVSLDPGRLGRQTANAEYKATKFPPFLGDNAKTCDKAAEVPALTEKQNEALDTFNKVAHEHRLSVPARPGDMLFVNNWALLHARDPYMDGSAGGAGRRHLVRVWLHDQELSWDPPDSMKTPWAAAFGHRFPDSIEQTGGPHRRNKVNHKYPIMPAVNYQVPKYTAGSAAFVVDSSDDEDDDHLDRCQS